MTVPNRNLVSHRDVRELRGPLMVVGDADGVGWDEFAGVDVEGGAERHALVLEINGDQALLQVLEGTEGMRLGGISVRFQGDRKSVV